jgi:hypothetical protein
MEAKSMARKSDADPLNLIPHAATVREELAATERRARRLRILLDTAERIEQAEYEPAAADDARRQQPALTGAST